MSSRSSDDRVSTDDLAQALRAVTGPMTEARGQVRQAGLVSATVGVVTVLGGAFLWGRRRGRKHRTVVEIRRV